MRRGTFIHMGFLLLYHRSSAAAADGKFTARVVLSSGECLYPARGCMGIVFFFVSARLEINGVIVRIRAFVRLARVLSLRF